MKVKLDLNVPMKVLSGDSSTKTVGVILANILATETKGDALKLWGWALLLDAGQPLELDLADKATLRQLVSANERMMVVLKAQILEILDSLTAS